MRLGSLRRLVNFSFWFADERRWTPIRKSLDLCGYYHGLSSVARVEAAQNDVDVPLYSAAVIFKASAISLLFQAFHDEAQDVEFAWTECGTIRLFGHVAFKCDMPLNR